MSKGSMESNKEEMRVAEVVEEVVDSKEEEVANITTNQALTTNKSSLPELCNRRERTVHLWLSRCSQKLKIIF